MARITSSERLENIDRRLARVEQILPTLATKDDLKGMPTVGDPKGFATKDDLKDFATKDDLKDALKGVPTVDDPKGFVTTAILHQALAEHGKREGKLMRAFVVETVQNGLAAQRDAFKADMRALIEEERDRWKALADGLAATVASLHRVEKESKARDRMLDRRLRAAGR